MLQEDTNSETQTTLKGVTADTKAPLPPTLHKEGRKSQSCDISP